MQHATPVVFIVDDDVSVRESLESLIRCVGWQPRTFASAHEFLSRPGVDAPSCLLLDVKLPDLSGLDLQQRVAGDRIDMPIIFITGYGDVPMTVRAMKAGAVEFRRSPSMTMCCWQPCGRPSIAALQLSTQRSTCARCASVMRRSRDASKRSWRSSSPAC